MLTDQAGSTALSQPHIADPKALRKCASIRCNSLHVACPTAQATSQRAWTECASSRIPDLAGGGYLGRRGAYESARG